ncbi:MAG: alpha/beta hydrolase [Bacillota bacterium]|nr:alpha/beta hydrolase [Bacillota bacterium]
MRDIQNYFIEKGTGFPFILLHGNGEDHTYFVHQIEYFSKMYRVFALDTRGHGRTKRGSKSFTIVQFAQDLYEFLNEKQIEKAHILGFSDGGNIALTFALKYPEKVESLIVNGANLFPKGVKRWVQWPIEIEYRLTQNKQKKELLGLMVKEPNIDPEELKELEMPVLVIAGDHDMIQENHTKLIAESIPNAVLSILPGTHFVAKENYTEFNRIVENFLKGEL